MRIAAAILLILGLLFGPGYYLYSEHFNGRVSARIELTERAERWTLPDGTIQRFPGRLAYRPVEVSLHPDRNLALFVLTFDMASEGSDAAGENLYQATLFDMDRPALQQEIHVQAAPGKSARVVLPPVTVRSPLQHLFILEELRSAAQPVQRVRLELRENAEPYVKQLIGIGAGLLLAGIALLAYDRITGQRQRR